MYAPLQFIEQVSTLFNADNPDYREYAIAASKGIVEWMDKKSSSRDWSKKFILDFVHEREHFIKFNHFSKDIRAYWTEERESFSKVCYPLAFIEDDMSFHEALQMLYINSAWRFHKFAYRVEDSLANSFLEMDLPDSPGQYFKSLPTSCFYVDLENTGDKVCRDIKGVFAVIEKCDDCIYTVLTAIVHGAHNRMIPVYTVMKTDGAGDEFVCRFDDSLKDRFVGEDGIKRTFNTGILMRYFMNFLLYLNASNKDVVEVDSKKEDQKAQEQPEELQTGEQQLTKKHRKNKKKYNSTEAKKRKQLKEFELGYRVIKNSNSSRNSTTTVPKKHGRRSVTSHFRRAHWHTYWVGKRGDKKKVLRHVEEIWVNGKKEQPVAMVHEVS